MAKTPAASQSNAAATSPSTAADASAVAPPSLPAVPAAIAPEPSEERPQSAVLGPRALAPAGSGPVDTSSLDNTPLPVKPRPQAAAAATPAAAPVDTSAHSSGASQEALARASAGGTFASQLGGGMQQSGSTHPCKRTFAHSYSGNRQEVNSGNALHKLIGLDDWIHLAL